MAGAKVTAEAAQRELWGPGIGDVAGFQKRILCQKKDVYRYEGHNFWVSYYFRQCSTLPPFFHFDLI